MRRVGGIVLVLALAVLGGAAVWLRANENRREATINSARTEAAVATESAQLEASAPVSDPPRITNELLPATAVLSDVAATAHEQAPKARFRGRLVYESNGDALPWCAVAVRADGTAGELRISGGDGRFATAFEYTAGTMQVIVCDEPSFPHDWSNASLIEHNLTPGFEHQISVKAWPTLVFDGPPPGNVDATRLVSRFPWNFMEVGLRRAKAIFAFCRVVDRPLEYEENQRTLDEARRQGPPWKVLLTNGRNRFASDPLLVGEAEFDRFEGVVRAPVHWSMRGVLRVSFRTTLTVDPDWPVEVRLRAGADVGNGQRRTVRQGASLREGCSFADLPPGSYELDVETAYCEPAHADLKIEPGKMATFELPLQCEPVAGVIRGEITSESGAYHDAKAFADLRVVGPRVRSAADVNISWSLHDDRWVGEFVFVDLPAREYTVVAHARPFALQPEAGIVTHPGERVAFTVLDNAPRVDVGFRVFELGTEAELGDFEVSVNNQRKQAHPGEIVLSEVPENGDVSWTISRRGYSCVKGNLREASSHWFADGPERWITAELAPVTPLTIHVRGPSNEPLAGAAVWIDDAEVGRTDDRGCLDIVLDDYPSSIDVRYHGWHHSQWSRPITGSTLDPCGYVVFALEP